MGNHAQLLRQAAGLPVLRRGRRFIEFDLGNGVRQAVLSIDPLHLADNATEVDTGIVADSGAWQWKMAAGDYQFHARSVFNAGGLMEWRIGSEWVTLDPQSINWTDETASRQQIAIKQAVTGLVSDAVLNFPAAYGAGIHFRYEAVPTLLRKLITVDALANLPAETLAGNTVWFEAEFALATSAGVDFYLDGVKWAKVNGARVQTSGRIELRDAATGTQVLWKLDQPTAMDANGKMVVGQYEVRRSGAATSLFITVRIPRTWILTAAFPIQIDPSLTLQPDATAGLDSYLQEASPNSPGDTLDTGPVNNSSGTNRHLLVKFDLSSISGVTASAGVLTLYNNTASPGVDVTADLGTILVANSAWTEALATWNTRDGSAAWAGSVGCSTSGTDFNATIATAIWGTGAASGTAHDFTMTLSHVQAWIDGNNYGAVVSAESFWVDVATSDHATAAWRPKLVVTYLGSQPATGRDYSLFPKPIMRTL